MRVTMELIDGMSYGMSPTKGLSLVKLDPKNKTCLIRGIHLEILPGASDFLRHTGVI